MGRVGHGHERARGGDSFGEEVEGSPGRRLPHGTTAEMAGVGQGSTVEAQAISLAYESTGSRERGKRESEGSGLVS